MRARPSVPYQQAWGLWLPLAVPLRASCAFAPVRVPDACRWCEEEALVSQSTPCSQQAAEGQAAKSAPRPSGQGERLRIRRHLIGSGQSPEHIRAQVWCLPQPCSTALGMPLGRACPCPKPLHLWLTGSASMQLCALHQDALREVMPAGHGPADHCGCRLPGHGGA